MTFTALFLIIFSAVLHVTWNLLAKKNQLTIPFYSLIVTAGAVVWLHTQFWTPVVWSELPLSFWGALAGSVVADVCYCCGLIWTYRKMEMASCYPMMRALPILLTAGFTRVLGWGAPLSGLTLLGFGIVFLGALLMPLNRWADFKLKQYCNWSMAGILLTALGTTGYTILDSRALGVICATMTGISLPVASISYYSFRGVGLAATLWIICACRSDCRATLRSYVQQRNFTPLLAGIVASGTYISVLLAMNYVTNVSYVQVFRQLGLPLGMAGGIIFLKERSAGVKWLGVTLILTGLVVAVLG